MAYLTPGYGLSGDEVTQWKYGRALLQYYATLGADREVISGAFIKENSLQYYGGLFDTIGAFLIQVVRPRDEFLVRHYLNMLFGYTGLVAAGLVAREITGRWSAALMTLILLAASPRFFGECFNNPKDIPFAAASLLFIYALIRWLKGLDRPVWGRTIALGCAMLLGLAIRSGGLLFMCYLLLFTILYVLLDRKRKIRTGRITLHLLAALLIGYLGACLFWPYALEDPLNHPLEAIKIFSRLPFHPIVLFEGRIAPANWLPAYYGPKMLAITAPLVILAGFAVFLTQLLTKNSFQDRRGALMLLFFTLFPLAFMILFHSILFDGVRHMLFILANLAVCAGIGIDGLAFNRKMSRNGRVVTGLAAAGLLALPLRFMMASHPFEYTYYNETVGGLKGAYARYETDYYMHSVKQAYNWLAQHEQETIRKAPGLKLMSNAPDLIVYGYQPVQYLPIQVVDAHFYAQNSRDWDYGIFVTRFLDAKALLHGYYPSSKAIHLVMADGVPLCAVLKNDQDRFGYRAFKALEEKRFGEAVLFSRLAVAKYPNDFELWTHLAQAYAALDMPDSARYAIDQALRISDVHPAINRLAGELALRFGDTLRAVQVYKRTTRLYPESGEQWMGLARAQLLAGRPDLSKQALVSAYLTGFSDYAAFYSVMAQLTEAEGDYRSAQQFRRQAEKLSR